MYGDYYKPMRPGGNKDTVSLVLGLISFVSCSCLMPVSVILGVLAVVTALRFRRAGGEWGWQSALGVAFGAVGCLFGIFLTALTVYVFVTKDPDSIYGILASFGK